MPSELLFPLASIVSFVDFDSDIFVLVSKIILLGHLCFVYGHSTKDSYI